LPGKLAVQGLPGVKRRDAAVGRALDCEIPRRQDRPARGGRRRRFWQVRTPGLRYGGWPGERRVRGNGAAAAARAVRPQRKGSGPGRRPAAARLPASPPATCCGTLGCPALPLDDPCALALIPAGAGRSGAPKACPRSPGESRKSGAWQPTARAARRLDLKKGLIRQPQPLCSLFAGASTPSGRRTSASPPEACQPGWASWGAYGGRKTSGRGVACRILAGDGNSGD
jgi:hypothetical protein